MFEVKTQVLVLCAYWNSGKAGIESKKRPRPLPFPTLKKVTRTIGKESPKIPISTFKASFMHPHSNFLLEQQNCYDTKITVEPILIFDIVINLPYRKAGHKI